MNVLWLGTHLWPKHLDLAPFLAPHGHALRTLTISEDSDYHFGARETAAQVVERISREWPVDLFLCWLPELFPPPLEIEHCPIPAVAIFSDWNIYFPQLEYNLARFDRVYGDKLGAQKLQLRGASPEHYFSFYSQNSAIHRKLDIEKDIDVAFAGSLNHAIHAERSRCLERIAGLSERYRIRICSGYPGEAYTRLLNRARIVFNHAVRSEMNMRCFETLACGSLLFLEESNLEVRDYLQDRHEVVLYRPDNLTELLVHYLEHEDEARAIAEKGHAKASELALERRLPAFLEALATLKPSDRTHFALTEEEKRYADVMLYSSSLEQTQQTFVGEAIESALARFPDSPAFQTMAAQQCVKDLDGLTGEDRKAAVQKVLGHLQRACELLPGDVVPWLNLAAVCARSATPHVAIPLYERAAQASTCALGALLMGSVTDPFYVEFRRALAIGEARPELLKAMGATRLAEMLAERGDPSGALEWANSAADWWPGVSPPYRAKAAAQIAMGDAVGAVDSLEAGLSLTAFDAEYRSMLIDAYRGAGRTDEARALAFETAQLFDACEGQEIAAARFRDIGLVTRAGI